MTEATSLSHSASDIGSTTSRLEILSLTRSFASICAVREFSLVIAPGEIHALCGHNGAGKSTVVRMLSGQLQPDSGEFTIDGSTVHLHSPQAAQRSGIAHVDQELSVIPSLTVAENLMLGDVREPLRLRRRSIKERSRELLQSVGLSTDLVDVPLSALSIGQRQLVEIARSLHRGAKVLLLDEPTATLSKGEIELVFGALRKVAEAGSSVVFVSHRLSEVIELCHRVTVMRDGSVVATVPTEGLQPSKIVSLMLGKVPDPISSVPHVVAEPNLVVSNLVVPGIFGPVNLQIRPGRIYGLAGQVGSGAAEILRAMAGLYPSARGHVTLAGRRVPLGRPSLIRRRGIAFVPSDRKAEGLFLSKDVLTNLLATRLKSLSRFGVLSSHLGKSVAARLASTAEVSADRLGARTDLLSGGNQQKVLVGRSLDDPSVKVLLLDEPTRGVDVAGRSALHGILRATAERGVAIVFSSTELDELVDLAHTIITVRGGNVVATYESSADQASVLADITHAA